MQLQNLAARAEATLQRGENREITGVTIDSRKVEPGFLFIAIPGVTQDGRDFIRQAVHAGAAAVLVPEDTPLDDIPPTAAVLTTNDIRRSAAGAAAGFYPERPACIVAVTGTSGKTSTVQFTRQIWTKAAGHKSASLGTLGLIAPHETHYGSLTTPDPITLHQALDDCAKHDVTHLAMEASSHGIVLHRLDFVPLEAAAFTNIARDHLDYHKTEGAYFEAKRQLFTRLLPCGKTAVLNADSPRFPSLLASCMGRNQPVIGFGTTGQEIRLISQRPEPKGQILALEVMGRTYDFRLPLIGAFQALNVMTALGLALATGVDQEKAIEALTRLEGVPGRLQYIGESAAGGAVFVDYAHKPDALESVLSTLRPHIEAHPGSRLHVVFGCGGNRDKGKRPIMGEIAQRLADEVIVTDDNPRGEVAATIRAEILAACQAGEHLKEIGDRHEAIEQGIKALGKNDILVIAGKGHESGQIVGDKVLPFNDAEVVQATLKATGGSVA